MRRAIVCHDCGSEETLIVPGLEGLGLVTSDCRPWEGMRSLAWCPRCGLLQTRVAQGFLDDCTRIYETYEVYHQAGGQEQKVFTSQGAFPARSEHLLRQIFSRHHLPESGRLLDVGCGNGVLIKSFGMLRPGWRLSGLDLDQRSREKILALPGVEAFHCCALTEIPDSFDMVSLMHCLEHVPGPTEFLRKAGSCLAPGGLLLVQVPDFTANPFDLAIADHCTHFTTPELEAVALRAGFEPILLERGLVAKELTLLARKRISLSSPMDPAVSGQTGRITRHQARLALDWLAATLARAKELAQGEMGVFGTSIGGAWLYGQLGDTVRFFIDEDENRVGRELFGKPVLRPDQAPDSSTVYFCLPHLIAQAIVKRLPQGRCRLELPPEFPLPGSPKENDP